MGLEPSCLFMLKDEYSVLMPRTESLQRHAMLFEQFLAAEADVGRLELKLKPVAGKALLHGHCHQKAFGAMGAVERTLRMIPGLEVSTVESSCCGMAGSFGYEAEHYQLSMKMAEADLLPAVRKAGGDTLVVADGTSCRHQIAHGAQRDALHVARVLERALA
jgi:Fe-S oxidoreductase